MIPDDHPGSRIGIRIRILDLGVKKHKIQNSGSWSTTLFTVVHFDHWLMKRMSFIEKKTVPGALETMAEDG